MRTLSGMLILVGMMASSCQGQWQLPDRTNPAVLQEEQRLATLLGASDDVLSTGGGNCEVRLLGRDGETSYAWAHCEHGGGEGASVPVRVDGRSVRVPGDGSDYSEDVEALFPGRLADEILEHDDRLRP